VGAASTAVESTRIAARGESVAVERATPVCDAVKRGAASAQRIKSVVQSSSAVRAAVWRPAPRVPVFAVMIQAVRTIAQIAARGALVDVESRVSALRVPTASRE